MGHYLYHKNLLLSESSITITADEHANGPAKYLLDPALYNCWRSPTTTPGRYMRCVFDFGSAKTADYWALIGHNFMDLADTPTIRIEYSTDDISYSEADNDTPTYNIAMASPFTSQSARYWRITLDAGSGNTIDTDAFLSVFYIGERTEFTRIMAPFTPPGNVQGYAGQNNINKNGQFIGRSNRFSPFKVDLRFRYETPANMRSIALDIADNIAQKTGIRQCYPQYETPSHDPRSRRALRQCDGVGGQDDHRTRLRDWFQRLANA